MGVFNKTNDVLIVYTFKNVFQGRSSEAFKPDVPFRFSSLQCFDTVGWESGRASGL